jgi:hypothetical protein
MATMITGAIINGIAGNKAAEKQAGAMDRATQATAWQGQIAQDQYQTYKDTYLPLEKQMVADAQDFDSPEAMERAAGNAQSTVANELGKARARLSRTPGFDPSSAAAQAAASDMELKGAAMGAGAQNQARDRVRDMGWARKMDALGLGKGLVTNASNGMAAAAASASSLARTASIDAENQARNMGALAGGIFKGIGGLMGGGIPKFDWKDPGYSIGAPDLSSPISNPLSAGDIGNMGGMPSMIQP